MAFQLDIKKAKLVKYAKDDSLTKSTKKRPMPLSDLLKTTFQKVSEISSFYMRES